MDLMNDMGIKILEDEMRASNSHSTYPIEYDYKVDPDPRLDELERQVARLKAERDHYGDHLHECRRSDKDGCVCGWLQVKFGTLWDHVDESEDIQEAVESHWG